MSDEEKNLANQDENKASLSHLEIPEFLTASEEKWREFSSKQPERTHHQGIQSISTVENCRVKFGCNQRWDNLTDQGKDGMRFCSACEEDVHWCSSQNEVIKAKSKGRCVAFMKPRGEVTLGKPIGIRRGDSWFTILMVWLKIWK